MREIRRELGIGAWNGSGGLYGTPAQVREARRLLKSALRGKVDRLQFVNDRLLGPHAALRDALQAGKRVGSPPCLKVLVPVYGLLKGMPDGRDDGKRLLAEEDLPPPAPDPDRDGCGLLWCSPVVPNTGADAAAVTGLVTRLLLEHGFEPQMSLSIATERMLICVITISYDRDVPGEDERALACYRALSEELVAQGYPPYRLEPCVDDSG